MIFHSPPLIPHCPNPNFEKWSSCFVFLRYDNPKFINLLSSWKTSDLPGQTKKSYQAWWINTLLEKKVCDRWVSAAERQSLMGKRSQPASRGCFLHVLAAALVPSWTLQHPVQVTAGPASHRTAGSSKQCTSLCQTHKMSLLNSTDEPNTHRALINSKLAK